MIVSGEHPVRESAVAEGRDDQGPASSARRWVPGSALDTVQPHAAHRALARLELVPRWVEEVLGR